MNSEINEKLMSVREAAEECGRNAETVRRWIWAGKLPAEKLGNQLFIKSSDFNNFCRETVTMRYDAGSRLKITEQLKDLRERIRNRIGGDFTEEEVTDLIQHQRQERLNGISDLR